MGETAHDLDDLVNRCKDAAGYVLGVGIVTNHRDKAGNNVLDFQYRRHHMSLEDTKQVIEMFREQLQREVDDQFRSATTVE